MNTERHFDCIVLGGGVIGAATAERLQRAGLAVLLIEQWAPGHTRGSSHGDGRIIRSAYPEAIYVEMARHAYTMWEELGQRAGERLWQRSGGWDCGPADSPMLAEVEATFRHFSIPYERLSATASARRFPHFQLPAGSEALWQADAGVVFATRAVQALWRLFQAAGGIALTGQRVRAVEPLPDGVEVHSENGQRWRGARLLVAAGGWARELLASLELALPLSVTQEQVAYFAPHSGPDHRVGAMPTFIDYHTEQPFYGLPQVEVAGVKVGWHHTGALIEPDLPAPLDEDNLRTLQRFVAERLPHLDPTPLHAQPCLYTNSPDYHFVLDHHPAWPQIVVATGFSGHGFKFAPVIAWLLAALLLGKKPPLPVDTFAIHRFTQAERLVRRTGA